MSEWSESVRRISTGIEGLDVVLKAGLIANRRYLVRGDPGLGKTTLGVSFLAAGKKAEPALFIGFQEPPDEVRNNAMSLGIDTSSIEFLRLSPDEDFFIQNDAYDVFASSDVEQEPLSQTITDAVERFCPKRVFIDSLTQLRFMSADVFQFRRQAMALLNYLVSRDCTVLFTSESSRDMPDNDLQFIADGVMNLERTQTRCTIHVSKFRGSAFDSGPHQFRVSEEGFSVYPRQLPPLPRNNLPEIRQLGSGNADLDAMLNGGLESSTVTLLTGPTGVGKSTLAACYAIESARQGHPAAVYIFEEECGTFMGRLRALGFELDELLDSGNLLVDQVEPLRYLSDEFTCQVRDQVETKGIEMVVLDSVEGFNIALEAEEGVGRPLHAFAKALARLGVTVILVNENHVTTDTLTISDRNISYLSDNVIYLRYLQTDSTLQKTIGVLKKRMTDFDNHLQLFNVTTGGFEIKRLPDNARKQL
ncbi:ATPase domain-containing protein [Marinimicrobium sp. C2-29]|uniref:ATPase domain-containing protein n=1 Tax=Marinimicrobium sp. C2-29 TaxID=3139825 RepID=UPI003138B3A2